LTVHIFALIIYSGAELEFHTLKKHDLADTLYEILEGRRTWKFSGVALRNKDSIIKK
jgi:hypothetical protein